MSRNRRKGKGCATCFPVVFFGIFIVLGFWATHALLQGVWRQIALDRDGIATEGKIVALRDVLVARKHGGPQVKYYPTIVYTDHTGRARLFESPADTDLGLGKTVSVTFSKDDPEIVVLGKGGGWFSLLIGFGFLLIFAVPVTWMAFGVFREHWIEAK